MLTACNGIRKVSGVYWRHERHITRVDIRVVEFRRLLIKHGLMRLNSENVLSSGVRRIVLNEIYNACFPSNVSEWFLRKKIK